MEAQQRYQQLRQDYANMLGKVTEIEGERREYIIVHETLRKVNPERKCWRLVGGVLVERKASEVIPQLEMQIDQMVRVVEQLSQQLNAREQELRALEAQLGVKSQARQTEEQPEAKSSGVLVG